MRWRSSTQSFTFWSAFWCLANRAAGTRCQVAAISRESHVAGTPRPKEFLVVSELSETESKYYENLNVLATAVRLMAQSVKYQLNKTALIPDGIHFDCPGGVPQLSQSPSTTSSAIFATAEMRNLQSVFVRHAWAPSGQRDLQAVLETMLDMSKHMSRAASDLRDVHTATDGTPLDMDDLPVIKRLKILREINRTINNHNYVNAYTDYGQLMTVPEFKKATSDLVGAAGFQEFVENVAGCLKITVSNPALLNFRSLMIQPIQRMGKYVLLFKELNKADGFKSSNDVYESCQKFTSEVNERIRMWESLAGRAEAGRKAHTRATGLVVPVDGDVFGESS